jgi:hypothetical protein
MNLPADSSEAPARVGGLAQGLAELGWTIGRNVKIEYRWAAGDANRNRRYAAELVALAPELRCIWQQLARANAATCPQLAKADFTSFHTHLRWMWPGAGCDRPPAGPAPRGPFLVEAPDQSAGVRSTRNNGRQPAVGLRTGVAGSSPGSDISRGGPLRRCPSTMAQSPRSVLLRARRAPEVVHERWG